MVEISLIPKKEKKPVTIGSLISISLISIFVLSVFASIGLFLYKKNLQDKVQNLADTQKELQAQRDIGFEKSILELNQDIKNAKNLLSLHLIPSRVFNFLEEGVHPKVQFLSAGIDFTKATLTISALAENFEAFDGQLDILSKRPETEKIEVSGISLGEDGRINFDLNISLSPQFLKYD